MIIYRDAIAEDMQEVAKVHIATQPEYFTSTLGEDLLAKFYSEFLFTDKLFVVAFDDLAEKIVGFCMGNYYTSQAEKEWERKYRNQIIRRLLFKCLQFDRLAISRVITRIRGRITKKTVKRDKYFCHLLSLGVMTEYRGKKIGSSLIDEFEARCIKNAPEELGAVKRKTCTIGAYKWNTAGCELYKYKGYMVFEETKDKLKFVKELSVNED